MSVSVHCHVPRGGLLVATACVLAVAPAAGAPVQDEYRVALKELSRAASAGHPGAFLAAFATVVRKNDPRSVRSAVDAYSEIAPSAMKNLSPREFMALHGQAAAEFAAVTRKEAVDEVRRLLAKGKDWQGRLLLLDASGFLKPSLLLESCRAALKDPHPIVIRRALQYLVKSKDVPVVEAVVDRYVELDAKRRKDADPQWGRTLLAFQATLEQMLKLDLPAAEDYKNYFEAHRKDDDLFDPRRLKGGARTGISLFGTVVTGKNIAFVLDVSGSMLSTDPLPGDAPRPPRPRTAVGDPSKQPKTKDEPPSDRQRMHRAKTELSKVVRALPEDVRFNVISYSSDVTAWKKSMVPASDANKKAALEHIESLKAEGITVTDLAIEDAFADLQLDTVYLITDGAPTHIGSTGPGLPEDAPALIRVILARVEELNFLRGVRVFTLGFPDAEEEFLKKLATAHGGTYAAIK